MLVTELLEEVRRRFDNADFIEIRLEDGQLRVYQYDDEAFELTQAKCYEHFSDIRMINPDEIVDDTDYS